MKLFKWIWRKLKQWFWPVRRRMLRHKYPTPREILKSMSRKERQIYKKLLKRGLTKEQALARVMHAGVRAGRKRLKGATK